MFRFKEEMVHVFFIMITSLCMMMLAEIVVFRRHMKPIREMLEQETPDLTTSEKLICKRIDFRRFR